MFEAATNEELCADWQRDRDPRVRDALVRRNMGLVRQHANAFRRPDQFEDLVQEGCIGFLRALDKWDVSRQVKLTSYAVWWVRAYQRRYFLSIHRIVAFGTTAAQRKLYSHFSSLRSKLDASGIGTTPENVARFLGLDLKRDRVEECLGRLSNTDASIDAATWLGEATDATAERDYSNAELLHLLRAEILAYREQLSPRERKIFDARLVDEDKKTLGALGERYGVSRERVRQLERRMLGRLTERVLAKAV